MKLVIIDDEGKQHPVVDDPIEDFDFRREEAVMYVLGSLANEIDSIKTGIPWRTVKS
jgi:hypothetical protein